jgi:hypothetical protein
MKRYLKDGGVHKRHPFFKFQITSTNIQNPNGQYKKVLNLGIGILNLFGLPAAGRGFGYWDLEFP